MGVLVGIVLVVPFGIGVRGDLAENLGISGGGIDPAARRPAALLAVPRYLPGYLLLLCLRMAAVCCWLLDAGCWRLAAVCWAL